MRLHAVINFVIRNKRKPDRESLARLAENRLRMPKFVVQEHHARTHHFDFRLEKDGVYKSWAVPKGVPETAGVKRLALQVDDHDLAFGSFEGELPAGKYGAGKIRIWDSGEYTEHHWKSEDILFTLAGKRLHGHYRVAKFRKGKPREWLLFTWDDHK